MASGAYVTTNISSNLKNVFFEKPLDANKALSKASFSKSVYISYILDSDTVLEP